ncbi:NAD(P)/FAD-dependent oxidoreductase [Candidatus Dojkabacteria bacterium]|uniref:NAD(P)/FAD-dependent oxidoreductase n=1 Tax=Candidatus Dojkabacteria bacterium TaxID=2099670 RepID=A0A955L413_9BACT|nr:NAD(P)/FAD-dependent oxidoreductase [Candidatus Dojkabacteria bacterium]
MKVYDVLVVGAGPAGGQSARMLSKLGYKVLIIERVTDFSKNNFSSAGSTMYTVEEFNIDKKCISTYWSSISVNVNKVHHKWNSNKPLGVIFEFKNLKQFLVDDAVANGAEALFGTNFVSYKDNNGIYDVVIKDIKTGKEKVIRTKLIIDATGPARKVLGRNPESKFGYGIGMEYLIEVPAEKYKPQTLTFFLGTKWVENGYGWMFAMKNRRFKVGSMQLKFHDEDALIDIESKIKNIIKTKLKLNEDDYKFINKHGGTLIYSLGHNDFVYKDRILCVGDSISSVNPLGGEGIRHSMETAKIAVKAIDDYFKDSKILGLNYQTEIENYYKCCKYDKSESIAMNMYKGNNDELLEAGFKSISHISIHDLFSILFFYNFGIVFKHPKIFLNLISDIGIIKLLRFGTLLLQAD